MALQLVDSHCHLDFPDFADDLPALLDRARAMGVTQLLSISTKLSTHAPILALAQQYPQIYCSLGIHPHHASAEGVGHAAAMRALIENQPKIVAIGECGLDYYYDFSTPADQQASFQEQLRLARAMDLPVIIHTRDAEADTIAMLEDGGAGKGLRGVMHCFTGSAELASRALDWGFYISFSGIVSFKSAASLQAIARDVPADRLLIETDAPYLAPVPMRGKRNEPAYLRHTAEFVAQLRGVTLAQLAAETTANFYRLFSRVPQPHGA